METTSLLGRSRLALVGVLCALTTAAALAPAAAAAPPSTGTVVEGASAPGVALGSTRAAVEASWGSESFCQGALRNFCTYNVGIGSVSVWYRGADGGDATASPGDVLFNLAWSGFPGWTTTAGITTANALADPAAAVAAYPGAALVYNQFGLYSLRDEARGLSITWVRSFYSGTVTVSIAIFAGTGSPPPPPPPEPKPVLHVASIAMAVAGKNVTAVVTVRDAGGAPVAGAAVAAEWTAPRGGTKSLSSSTDQQGRATFSVRSSRGTHTIAVVGVAKDGFDYDAAGSVTTESISVGR